MSRVYVSGWGAVSPAGWNVTALRAALDQDKPLPVQALERPGWEKPLRTRSIPIPVPRPALLAHPRLRRSSPITHYAAAAALEAAAGLGTQGAAKTAKLGLVICLQSGCVRYTTRFYAETLNDPATASPLLFPETVYAAPASHIAAVLGDVVIAYSLVGDPSAFLQGVLVGAQWLAENLVEACLVIGAEETDWIIADALWHLDRRATLTAGAGALCLSRQPATPLAVELAAVTDAHTYSSRLDRTHAAQAMRRQLPPGSGRELLCDGAGQGGCAEAPELAAWRDWTGARLSPKRILGEGLMASAAWQCVAACDALAQGRWAAANVSLVGANQQAIGARFVRLDSRRPDLSHGQPPVHLELRCNG